MTFLCSMMIGHPFVTRLVFFLSVEVGHQHKDQEATVLPQLHPLPDQDVPHAEHGKDHRRCPMGLVQGPSGRRVAPEGAEKQDQEPQADQTLHGSRSIEQSKGDGARGPDSGKHCRHFVVPIDPITPSGFHRLNPPDLSPLGIVDHTRRRKIALEGLIGPVKDLVTSIQQPESRPKGDQEGNPATVHFTSRKRVLKAHYDPVFLFERNEALIWGYYPPLA